MDSVFSAPDQAAAADPAVAEILGLLSRGYTQSAAQQAAKLLKTQPRHAEVQRLYGVALYRLNEREAALGALARAVELAPEAPAASWGLAEALHASGRTDEAVQALEALLSRRPEEPVALLLLARLKLAARDADTAYALARRALAADPEVEGGRALLATLAYEQGDLPAAAEALLADRMAAPSGPAQGSQAPNDPASLLARSLYALGRNRELAALVPAASAGERHNEAVLLALAAFRENNPAAAEQALEAAEADRPAAQTTAEETAAEETAAEGTNDAARGVAMYATLGQLLRTLLQSRRDHPDRYAGEVAHLIGLIGDSHVLSAGHLVVPWQGHRALLLPEPLLEATPSCLLAEPPEPQTRALRVAFAAALERLPRGTVPAVCLGELDLRLTQGLFSRSHALSDAELERRLQALASALAETVAAAGAARGVTPILVTPPASNAPLALVPEKVRLRFAAAQKRFVGTLREAAGRLRLPVVDLRAATERGGQAQAQLYVDTNHLWPEAWVRAFRQHVALPEQSAE